MKRVIRGLVVALVLASTVVVPGPRPADAQDKKDKDKAPAATTAVFEVYKDRGGEFRFRLKDADGNLLAAAGVETALELAQRVPEHLHQKLVETNRSSRLVRHMPSLERVAEWVEQAGQLTRVVSY